MNKEKRLRIEKIFSLVLGSGILTTIAGILIFILSELTCSFDKVIRGIESLPNPIVMSVAIGLIFAGLSIVIVCIVFDRIFETFVKEKEGEQ